MLTGEGQRFICPLNLGNIVYQRVILAFRGLFLQEKMVLQAMTCCPSTVNKCPFQRTYLFIFCKECLVFGYIICCPLSMQCLALYTVPLFLLVFIVYSIVYSIVGYFKWVYLFCLLVDAPFLSIQQIVRLTITQLLELAVGGSFYYLGYMAQLVQQQLYFFSSKILVFCNKKAVIKN